MSEESEKQPLLSKEDIEKIRAGTFGEMDFKHTDDSGPSADKKPPRTPVRSAKAYKMESPALDVRISKALQKIMNFGGIDGAHHKQWVLDQVVRILTSTKEEYEAWVKQYQGDYDVESESYEYDEWDKGTAP